MLFRPALLAGFALAFAARADNLQVAGDGSAPFRDVQDAVEAAQDGDVIWVAAGDYGPVSVVGKSVLIVGAGSGGATLASLSIVGVADGLAGACSLAVQGDALLSGNTGAVVLRDVSGADLHMAHCANVYVDCWQGLRGVARDVQLAWLSNCEFAGAAGADAVPGLLPGTWTVLPTAGGSAFDAGRSRLHVAGCTFTGGAGGKGSCLVLPGLLGGAPGGAGLRDVGGSTFLVGKSTLTGGAGGTGGLLCQAAPAGKDLATTPSTSLEWDQAGAPLFPLLVLTPSVLGGQTSLEIFGTPADTILLVISNQPGLLFAPGVEGFPVGAALGGGAHLTLWPLDRPIGPGGTLLWKHAIPGGAGLAGTPIFVQALLGPGPGVAHPPTLTSTSVSILVP